MILNSKYLIGSIEFIDCIIIFQYGIIQRVKFSYPSDGSLPKDYSNFVFRRFSKYQSITRPTGYNFILTYIGQDDKEQNIFFKLNQFQVFKLKWILNKYWIQETNNWIKFIIPIITGVTVYLITRKIYGC